MQTHILNRLGHAAVTLAIVSVITFLIVNLSPGGFVIEGASGMSREDMERIRENLGLNLPLHVQYWRWSTGILTGDMANRSRMDRRLPNSSGNDWARRFHWRSSWVAGDWPTRRHVRLPARLPGDHGYHDCDFRRGSFVESAGRSPVRGCQSARRVGLTMARALAMNIPVPATTVPRVTRFLQSRSWQRFARNRLAVGAGFGLILLLLLIAFGPILSPYSPDEGELIRSLESPSLAHLLETDANGRDLMTRILHGGRVSMAVGLVSVLAVLAVFPGGSAVAIVIGLTSWMSIAKVVRGEFLRWKSVEFVDAAHVIGASDWRIITQHILPRATPAMIVSATLGVAFAILTESAISYLGLGIQPPTPTWGNMLLEAQQYVWQNPWLAVYPGLMILVTVICFNAVGDGLRDALDPRMSDR